ncbi:hypothetical protein R3P38DRAFT_3196292 [Favolaschia claudopus]|uniref:Uncharacterized protein n=2 Tax=Favolaschia claudopus TaxID=2862362 RepID=A0AAW0B7H0_9AGAR
MFPGVEPSFIFLPTSFVENARELRKVFEGIDNDANLHREIVSPYSPEIIAIREGIRSGQVDSIGFVSWTNDHYSATCKVLSNPYEFGDSLNRCYASDLLPILRWAFSRLNRFAPPLQQQSIQSGLMDVQGYSGGGSCGIAATNFVELRAGLPIPRWQAEQSSLFRDLILQDLLLYHLIARGKTTTYSDWVVPCTRISNGEPPEDENERDSGDLQQLT